MRIDPTTRRLVMVNVRFISADYFSTLGIPLLFGRSIEAADRGRNAAAVSSRLAAKLWPGQNPLGKRIRRAGSGVDDAEVIGVVAVSRCAWQPRLAHRPAAGRARHLWVVAYSVALRRREIGIRVALGASMGDVRRLVLLERLRPVLTGLAAAMAAAIAMGGLIRALLFGVTPTDPATLLAVALGSAGVAAIACRLPARSAARLDPARVLRED
jgi:hypothetical protein